MVKSLQLIGATSLLLATSVAVADGWTLLDGRFPGATTVIQLSANQAARLEFIHKCHTDNTRTPYVFRLTRVQADLLKERTGVSATRFAVFDGTHGVTAVDLSANVIVRFAAYEAEIPHKLLVSDGELREYEQEIIGWGPNPIEAATASQVASSECPG